MLRTTKLVLLFSSISAISFAQNAVKPAVKPTTTAPTVKAQPVQAQQPAPPTLPPLKRINNSLEYAYIINKPTSPNPKEGDLIKINMVSASNGRMLYNSYQANKGKPVEFTVNKPTFNADIVEAIKLMTPGDSIVCAADAAAIFSNTKNKMPDFIKKGDKIIYFIKLVGIKSKEQLQKEQQAAFQKQMQAQMAKQKAEQEKLAKVDDKALQAYFTKNNITPLKTASGLYYTINEKGAGNIPANGDTVSMNYTGKLMDGTKFDSNEDTTFHHVQAFEFPLGAGRVIKGWDEGIALLNQGTKATLYIPSRLAYGAQSMPGSPANPKGIPANSILTFDVQLVNIKPQIKTETK